MQPVLTDTRFDRPEWLPEPGSNFRMAEIGKIGQLDRLSLIVT